MYRPVAIAMSIGCFTILGTNGVLADGNGTNRGLGAAAHGIPARPLGRPSDQLPRAHVSPPSGTAELGRKLNGLQRGRGGLEHFTPPGLSVSPRGTPAPNHTANPTRIYEHRMDQADHLRDLSLKNGNESLSATADRMEASAARNFERQTGVAPPTPEVPVEGEAVQTTPAPRVNFDTAARPKRGFWIRSR